MRKYLFYTDNIMQSKLNNELHFDKIGIRVRKINAIELMEIKDLLNKTIYLKKLYGYYDDYADKAHKTNEECIRILDRITALPRFEDIGYAYISIMRKNNRVIDKKANTRLLKSLYVIEVDDVIENVIDIKSIEVFLNKILNFTYFLSKELYEINNYTNSVGFIDYDNLFDDSAKYDSIFANISVLLDIGERPLKCDFDKLYQLVQLMNKKDIDYNFNYIMVIDSFINNSGLIENSIINGVSIIERILIGKESDKRSNFILKVGSVILNEEKQHFNKQELSKQLEAIYDIRSILSHGNDIKNVDKYASVFKTEIDFSQSKLAIRRELLISVSFYLTMYMKCIFNKFLSDYQYCEFLKEN